MKVNETALQNLLRAYSPKESGSNKGAKGSQGASDSSQGDEISISTEGQTLQRAIQAAQQASDVRNERVAEIRAQMQAGQYLLDPQAIADRMLGVYGGSNQ